MSSAGLHGRKFQLNVTTRSPFSVAGVYVRSVWKALPVLIIKLTHKTFNLISIRHKLVRLTATQPVLHLIISVGQTDRYPTKSISWMAKKRATTGGDLG